MKLKQPTPFSLVLNPEYHQALNVWIRLHAVFKNPVFYDWSYSKLAQVSGLGQTTLRKFVPVMISKGWCRTHGRNLCFKGINQFREPTVLIPIHNYKPHQIAEFRNAIIRHNIDRQKKQVVFKSEIVKKAKGAKGRLTPVEIKYLRKNPDVEKTINEPTLSNRRFGSLIERSKFTGQRLKKRLKGMELIHTKARFKVIKNYCTLLEYNHHYRNKGYILDSSNRLMQRLSDAIVYKHNAN